MIRKAKIKIRDVSRITVTSASAWSTGFGWVRVELDGFEVTFYSSQKLSPEIAWVKLNDEVAQ